jgi:hypothetical protein
MSTEASSLPALFVLTEPDGSIARMLLMIHASGARGAAVATALGSTCAEKATWKKEKEYSKDSKSAAANSCGSTTALPLIGGTERTEIIFLRKIEEPRNARTRCSWGLNASACSRPIHE